MDWQDVAGAPPPPPMPPTDTPPTSPPEQQNNAKALRPSPVRRPPLASSKSRRGLLTGGRERGGNNTESSMRFSTNRQRLGTDEMQQLGMATDLPPAATDKRLMWASLDDHAVEDEAENTLLDVLERRQAASGNQTFRDQSSHRRHQSSYATDLSNIDLTNFGAPSMERPTSAPSSSESGRGPPRPSLMDRRVQSQSRRNLLQRSMTKRAVTTGGWGFDELGDLPPSFSELSDHEGGDMAGSSPQVNQKSMGERESPPQRTSFPVPAMQLPEVQPNRQVRHRRGASALPMGFSRGISDSSHSSGPSGLTTPGERARFLAFNMKTEAAKTMDDPNLTIGGGDMLDLMHILEEKRENDDGHGSQNRSGGGGSRGKGSRSRRGSHHSNESISRGSKGGSSAFSGGFRTNRAFAGGSSSANDGFMSNVDLMFSVAAHVEELCQIPEEEEREEENMNILSSGALADENASFLSNLFASHPEIPEEETDEAPKVEGGPMEMIDEQTPMLKPKVPRYSSPRKRSNHLFSLASMPSPDSRFYKFQLWWADLRRQMKIFGVAFDADHVKGVLSSFFYSQVSLFILPALSISAFSYYVLGNPNFVALPTDASISWWILFAVRNYLTLQMAYITEYLFVDVLAISSPFSVQLIGPLPTLYTINAKGWPFILTTWGMLNLLLIHDSAGNPFYENWLYFTEIEMFTDENHNGGVVQSDTYKEILVSMIIAGVATSMKRSLLSIYLGKRIYFHYKPRLEKVMESMILLTEVAELGEAIDEHDFEFEKVDNTPEQRDSSRRSMSTTRGSTLHDKLRTSTMIAVVSKQKEQKACPDSDEEAAEEESMGTKDSTPWNRLRTGSDSSDEILPLDKDGRVPSQETLEKIASEKQMYAEDEHAPEQTIIQDDTLAELPGLENSEPPIPAIHEPVQGLLRETSATTSTTTHIKSLLEGWEEPVNKADKMADPTIHELLQFRKCLPFLDDTHPFGSAFGPALTRDSCIKSSKGLYRRLLALSPGAPILHFDIIGVLAYNVDGTFDDKKAKSLVRLFRPDKYDSVSLVHFAQSCDLIYKRIRFLRASVGNSTLIDSVLENIFNTGFFFFLGLSILSILKLNPWTLLVSMSTVLVSFAFALGPSAAKMIEGMIMIAVRRPFDLGDRISIIDCTAAPEACDPGYNATWIVEDCNLFTTTLRLTRTNELSTVNNGSIANSKIVNHGRSFNALVNISLRVNIAASHDQIQILKSAMEQYIRDNPRVWTCLINFRITSVDPAADLIVYSARIQHVKSWQDKLPILQARGDFEKFCQEILQKLDIHYDCLGTTNEVYIKEMPTSLPVQDMYPEEYAEDDPFPAEPAEGMASEDIHDMDH